MTTSFKLNLRRGAVVTGKWKQSRYRVERLLGEGANGKVYLVHADRGWCALKVGMDAIDLQSEINVLQTLEKQDRKQTYLYEVDDLLGEGGKEYPFYIMRYVRGVTISEFLEKNGPEWFPLIGLNLLGKLAELHRRGWVFGDLKIDNVLVADYGYVELVDYGGVTAMGKGIRQFTEIYDRGFWNAGSRSADARYDLFSFAVLCIMLHEPKKLHALTGGLPQIRSTEELERLISECKGLAPVAGWLKQALGGQFFDASEGAEAWRRLLHRRDTRVKSAKTPGWLKGLAAVSAVVLGISVYWLLRSGI